MAGLLIPPISKKVLHLISFKNVETLESFTETNIKVSPTGVIAWPTTLEDPLQSHSLQTVRIEFPFCDIRG